MQAIPPETIACRAWLSVQGMSVTDSSGGRLLGYENGRFQRGTATPSFAGRVQVAGYGEALSAALR